MQRSRRSVLSLVTRCQRALHFVIFFVLIVSNPLPAKTRATLALRDQKITSSRETKEGKAPTLDDDNVLMFYPTELLGLGLGLTYQSQDYFYFPTADFEFSLADHFTLGFLLNFRYQGEPERWTLTANSLLTANLYPWGRFQYGLIRLAGGGIFSHTGSATARTTLRPTILGQLGWRFLIRDSYSPLSVALMLGFQHIFDSSQPQTFPTLLIEIGALQ